MGLKKIYKLFNRKARIVNDCLESFRRDNFTFMERYNYPAAIISELNVVAFLTDRIKSSFIKGSNGFFSSKAGEFLHQIAISRTWGWYRRSFLSSRLMSFGSGSRYSSIASLIFLIASRFVVPQEWQPFREGQYE